MKGNKDSQPTLIENACQGKHEPTAHEKNAENQGEIQEKKSADQKFKISIHAHQNHPAEG